MNDVKPHRRALLRVLVALPLLLQQAMAFASALRPKKTRPHRLHPLGRSLKREQPLAAATSADPFTADERASIKKIVEAIIPTDSLPGAAETQSALFVIDNLIGRGPDTTNGIKAGLAAVEQLSLSQFGARFVDLPPAATKQLLQVIATVPDFAAFWFGIRSLTVLHFYAMPKGYEPLGLPGPSIDRGGFPFPETVACLK